MHSGTSGQYYIDCIEVDGDNNILAGTMLGGMIYSYDNGETWTKPDTTTFKSVTDLLINSEGHVYASIFNWPVDKSDSSSYAILRSPKTHGRWEDAGFDNFGSIHSMRMTSDGVLYVATRNGLYRSKLNGFTKMICYMFRFRWPMAFNVSS